MNNLRRFLIAFKTQNKKTIAIYTVLLLFLVTSVGFVQFTSLFSTAKPLDDYMYLTQTPKTQSEGWYSVYRFFIEATKPSTIAGYYQPITQLSLLKDAWLFNASFENLFPYHRTNLLLHLCNSILLFWLLQILFKRKWICLFASIVWGIHPISTEVTVWISERKTLLATFFALLSMLIYIQYRKNDSKKLYLFLILTLSLSLLSKPSYALLPIAFMFFDVWPLRYRPLVDRYEDNLKKLPLLGVTSLWASLAIISHNNSALPVDSSFDQNLARTFYSLTYYTKKIFFPIELSPWVQDPVSLQFSTPEVILGMFIAVAVLGVCILSYRRSKIVFYSLIFFLILYFPISGLWQYSSYHVGTRHLYFPIIALLFILVHGLERLFDTIFSIKHSSKRLVASSIALCFTFFLVLPAYSSRQYVTHWKDTQSLLQYMLSLYPTAGRLHFDLGNEYLRSGDEAKGIQELETALAFNFKDAELNLGLVYAGKKQNEKAVPYFINVMKRPDINSDLALRLSAFLFEMNQLSEILPYWESLYSKDPDNLNAQKILFAIYKQKGDDDKSYPMAIKLLQKDTKNPEIYKLLASISLKRNNITDAIRYAQAGIRIKADDEELMNVLNQAIQIQDNITKIQKSSTNIPAGSSSPLPSQGNPPSASPTPPILTSGNTTELMKQYETVQKEITEAKRLSEQNNYSASNQILERIVKEYPQLEDGFIYLGVNKIKQQEYQKAETFLKKALELNPAKKFVNQYLGILYTKLEKYKEAEEAFKIHLSNAPQEYSTYLNLGIVYHADKKPDKAIEMFKKALEINPKYANAYYSWSQIPIEKGQYQEAASLLQKALQINPSYIQAKQELDRITPLLQVTKS